MLLRRAEGRDVEALVELRGLMFEAMGATGNPEWRKAAADWFAEHIDDARVGAFVVDLNDEGRAVFLSGRGLGGGTSRRRRGRRRK